MNFQKVYDLQNSSRTTFYKNILFPKSKSDKWSSSETTLPTNILTLILSFSPGGIYEVAVIAIAFNLEPDFVAFHHIIRLLMILFTVPVILRLIKKLP